MCVERIGNPAAGYGDTQIATTLWRDLGIRSARLTEKSTAHGGSARQQSGQNHPPVEGMMITRRNPLLGR